MTTIELKPFFEECSGKKTFKKGEIIYHEGGEPEGLYLITSGVVGLVNILANGEESLLRVFGTGQFFGHRTMLANETYHGTTIVLEKTEVCFLEKERFLELIHERPEILLKMTEVLAKELRNAELRLSDLSGKKAIARIIEALVYLKTRHPDHKWTRKDIGEYSGTKMETVTRVLTRLEKEGHIEKQGRDILISNPQKLLDHADELAIE